MADVKAHSKEGDAWTVFHGNVVDISEFVARHPGGKAVLQQYAGKVRSLAACCALSATRTANTTSASLRVD